MSEIIDNNKKIMVYGLWLSPFFNLWFYLPIKKKKKKDNQIIESLGDFSQDLLIDSHLFKKIKKADYNDNDNDDDDNHHDHNNNHNHNNNDNNNENENDNDDDDDDDNDNMDKKSHLVKWSTAYMDKRDGGLRLEIFLFSTRLLCKWIGDLQMKGIPYGGM